MVIRIRWKTTKNTVEEAKNQHFSTPSKRLCGYPSDPLQVPPPDMEDRRVSSCLFQKPVVGCGFSMVGPLRLAIYRMCVAIRQKIFLKSRELCSYCQKPVAASPSSSLSHCIPKHFALCFSTTQKGSASLCADSSCSSRKDWRWCACFPFPSHFLNNKLQRAPCGCCASCVFAEYILGMKWVPLFELPPHFMAVHNIFANKK